MEGEKGEAATRTGDGSVDAVVNAGNLETMSPRLRIMGTVWIGNGKWEKLQR